MPAPDNLAWIPLLMPALLTLALARVFGSRAILANPRVRGACVVLLTPLLLIFVASNVGPNLTAARYLVPTALSIILLVTGVISMLSARATRAVVFVFLAAGIKFIPGVTGSLALATTQDWASVRRHLDATVADMPPILYRSGYVEEDAAHPDGVSPVDIAPLQPPGFTAFFKPVIPLTYSWNSRAIERLEDSVLPALEQGRTILFVSGEPYSSKTGPYGEMLSPAGSHNALPNAAPRSSPAASAWR